MSVRICTKVPIIHKKPSQINCDSFKLFGAFEKACVLGDAVFVVDFLFDELSKVVVAVKDVLVLVSVAG